MVRLPLPVTSVPLLVPLFHVEAPATVKVPLFVAPLMVATLAMMDPASTVDPLNVLLKLVPAEPLPILNVPAVCVRFPPVLFQVPRSVALPAPCKARAVRRFLEPGTTLAG